MNYGTSDDQRAPDGARCNEHPDRPARYTCPRCGCYACAPCWHQTASLCNACVGRDPLQAAQPPPFENRSLSLPGRVLSTLRAALYPRISASSFARSRIQAAARFFLITALPMSALSGVIPHTRTLLFGPGLQVELIGRPGQMEIASDVALAMLVQLVFDAITLLALALPYVTLTRSYGRPGATNAAVAMLFYRAWLIPAASLLSFAMFWVMPAITLSIALTLVVSSLAMVLLVYAMWSTARLTGGIGRPLSIVVVGVPWVLAIVVSMVLTPALIALFGLTQPGGPGGPGGPV